MLKKLIKKTCSYLNFEIRRISKSPTKGIPPFSMDAALCRCFERGIEIKTIIDVGASDGRWSRMCMDYYPKANYLLIEAQEAHRSGLELFKLQFNNVDYVIAAAGDREGKIYFDNSDLFGGLASDTPFVKNCIEVPVITIDKLLSDKQLEGPFLIKLDTHGFEVPILEGAKKALKSSQLLVIEAYNFKLTETSLKYFELCQYLEQLSFSSIEIVDLMLRQKDLAFWQMDIFFIPSERDEFKSNSYS